MGNRETENSQVRNEGGGTVQWESERKVACEGQSVRESCVGERVK